MPNSSSGMIRRESTANSSAASSLGPCQDAEKVRQRRSRIVQTLNVPQRVRLGPSLAAALLNSLFEHPAWFFPVVSDVKIRDVLAFVRSFSAS